MPVPSRAKKFAASDRDGVELSRRDENYDSAETPYSSAFLRCVDFCAVKCACGSFFAAASWLRCNHATPANAGPGIYTQNVVE